MLTKQECIICHYLNFLKMNFRFQLRFNAMNFNNAAIVTVKGNDYRIHLSYMSKDEAMNLLRKTHLTEKSETLQNMKIYYLILKRVKKL